MVARAIGARWRAQRTNLMVLLATGYSGRGDGLRPRSWSWLVVDRGGGVGEGVDAGLRLRERDHLADVLLAGEDRDEAVDADREAGVRRRAEPERVEQEAEALLRVLGVDAEQREDPLLHRRGGGSARCPSRAPSR